MDSAVTAIVGGLLLLALGWLKLDINRVVDKLDAVREQLGELTERVARIEGRLDEREHTER
jgi:uncharacterized membrane protein